MRTNMQRGGAGARPGFTLIELLIVVVIVGILASVAMAKYRTVKEKAFVSTMKSDLENLAKHQEIYHFRYLSYADEAQLTDYETSRQVDLTIGYAAGDGWGGYVTHSALAGVSCGFFIGNAPPATGSPATVPGVLACND